MKTMLRILLFPVRIILTLVVNISCFLVSGISGILSVLSFILFAGALMMFGFAVFGSSGGHYWQPAVATIIVSYLISPYGVPRLAAWLVIKVDDLNDFIKAI